MKNTIEKQKSALRVIGILALVFGLVAVIGGALLTVFGVINLVNNNQSVIATNWNNGSAPSYQYLKVYISKLLGKMAYVDSIGYDINTKQDINVLWSGWLPTEEITQVATLQ